MSKYTTKQLVDLLRKGDPLSHKMFQNIADRLESLQAENERLRGATDAEQLQTCGICGLPIRGAAVFDEGCGMCCAKHF